LSLGASVNILEREQKTAVISLLCKVFDNAEANNYPFSLVVSLSGSFVFDGDMDNESFLNFCKASGTSVLFPFLRSAVANITATGNVQPLMLPLINVHNFLMELEKAQKGEDLVKQD
jgi:preprotein translocase subunit SecB